MSLLKFKTGRLDLAYIHSSGGEAARCVRLHCRQRYHLSFPARDVHPERIFDVSTSQLSRGSRPKDRVPSVKMTPLMSQASV